MFYCIGGHHRLSIAKNPWSENFEFPLNFGHVTFLPKQQHQIQRLWAYHGNKQDIFNFIPLHFVNMLEFSNSVGFKSFTNFLNAYGQQ
jgi:hypothetical protein